MNELLQTAAKLNEQVRDTSVEWIMLIPRSGVMGHIRRLAQLNPDTIMSFIDKFPSFSQYLEVDPFIRQRKKTLNRLHALGLETPELFSPHSNSIVSGGVRIASLEALRLGRAATNFGLSEGDYCVELISSMRALSEVDPKIIESVNGIILRSFDASIQSRGAQV